MNFKEWLLLNEIPHTFFPTAHTVLLPDVKNDATKVVFDLIDMRTELYLKGEAYKRANLEGFNAKFPFSNDYLVCYGPKYDSRTFKTRIGQPDEGLMPLSGDWYKYAQFMKGNVLTYWAYKGVYQPVSMAVTA